MEYSLGLKINVDKTKRRLQDFKEFYGIKELDVMVVCMFAIKVPMKTE